MTNQHVFLDKKRIATIQQKRDNDELDSGSPGYDVTYTYNTSEDEENILFYHPDNIGSSVLLTNSDGDPYYRVEMKPYGEVWEERRLTDEISSTPGSDTGQPLVNHLFTGYERDFETGLDYAKARYYDPEVGRFTAVDPLDQSPFEASNLSLRSYAANNPINLTDPSGMTIPERASSTDESHAMQNGESSGLRY
jgi:RHS repeat-associated protein